jgi:hypothetical protein
MRAPASQQHVEDSISNPFRPAAWQFEDFAASHPAFLVYSDGRPTWDWWPTRLFHDGYALELVAMNQDGRIYLVRQKH